MKQLQVIVKNDRNSIHLAIELCKAKTNSVHESILEQVHTPTTIGMTEIHLRILINFAFRTQTPRNLRYLGVFAPRTISNYLTLQYSSEHRQRRTRMPAEEEQQWQGHFGRLLQEARKLPCPQYKLELLSGNVLPW